MNREMQLAELYITVHWHATDNWSHSIGMDQDHCMKNWEILTMTVALMNDHTGCMLAIKHVVDHAIQGIVMARYPGCIRLRSTEMPALCWGRKSAAGWLAFALCKWVELIYCSIIDEKFKSVSKHNWLQSVLAGQVTVEDPPWRVRYWEAKQSTSSVFALQSLQFWFVCALVEIASSAGLIDKVIQITEDHNTNQTTSVLHIPDSHISWTWG